MAVCVQDRAIGGFMPLEPGSRQAAGGLLAFWGVTDGNAWRFVNARSALAHLLRNCGARRLVLPAYICPELATAAADAGVATAYYPLSDALSPLVTALDAMLRPGDCAVAVDYFGRPPARDFRDLAAARDDVVWVEDRAQALRPGAAPWAEWVLYSPRKLFGVPDGGILLRTGGAVPAAEHSSICAEDRALPRILRRDDADESGSVAWFEAYRGVESRMSVSREPMSALTRLLLAGIDPEPVILSRRENFSILRDALPEFGVFDGPADDFAPFGYPVRAAAAEAIQAALARRRIFAARYWPSLPSDPKQFPAEHALARELLLLPCDQRYGGEDMKAVARAFRDIAG